MPRAIANRDALIQEVMDRVAAGEYVADICAEDGMPAQRTIWDWIDRDEEIRQQWVRARERSAAVEERRVAELAARVEAGDIAPEAARVAINARQWLAKIRDPRSYGDRLGVEHSGQVAVVPVLTVTIAGPAPAIIEGQAREADDGA